MEARRAAATPLLVAVLIAATCIAMKRIMDIEEANGMKMIMVAGQTGDTNMEMIITEINGTDPEPKAHDTGIGVE